MVRGREGAILGLIREEDGTIKDAKLFEVKGDIRPDTWYGLEDREPKEVSHEAVSYTHLDVYKRQALESCFLDNSDSICMALS